MSATAVDVVTTVRVRDRLRANRGLILLAVLVLVGATLLALAQSSKQRGLLDPRASDPSGSLALATLLEGQGVRVVRTTTAADAAAEVAAAGSGSTLVIAPTAVLSDRMLETIAGTDTAHLVLLAPDASTLDSLAPWASPLSGTSATDEVPANCSWDIAARAGALPPTGLSYSTTTPGAWLCWEGAVLDLAALDGERPATVVGNAGAFTNAELARSGNAALALGVLGRSDTVVWWLPSPNDPLQFAQDGGVSIGDLVPPWVGWALLQLALAVLVVVWWRARRLGRIVIEPLPVVVRATETVEGRARLYRRGGARGRAADALRGATLDRLRTRLSLPRGTDLPSVIAATSTRTGRPATELATLLTPGLDPTDDASLSRLADALDTLENEVRHS